MGHLMILLTPGPENDTALTAWGENCGDAESPPMFYFR